MMPSSVSYSNPSDIVHENKILNALAAMQAYQAIGQRTKAEECWKQAVRLISERSDEQVKRMEAELGLASHNTNEG